MSTFPLVMTTAGPQVTSPTDLRAGLISIVEETNPGYTANLPGSLIEDIASTNVAALSIMDSARVDLVNSISPYTANAYLLVQLGNVYGVPLGVGSNSSVYVTFSGTVGFTINSGFIVSDGTNQYVVQTGGVIGDDGVSSSLYCIAQSYGTWAIPANSVTQLITSVPSTITLTCTNPQAGLLATSQQTTAEYRSQVLQAGYASAQGMSSFLKTGLENVTGVQARLVSVRQSSTGGWQVICGGGDPYDVANAIFRGLFDLGSLVGSTLYITDITSETEAVVTTELNHGYVSGQVVKFSGVVGLTGINNTNFIATVITEKTFSINYDTSSAGTYESGGICTPNLRNITVSINDFPDTYVIPFINPPQQSVRVNIDWSTISTNYVSPSAVSQLANPAIVTYINSIYVGQPLSIYQMQTAFQEAISSVLEAYLIKTIDITVYINDIETLPSLGSGLVYGDPESYMETNSTLISINKV